MPFVRSLQRGTAATFTAPDGGEMTSALRKTPVEGPVACGPGGLEGDGVSHPAHGGPHAAVHVFPWDHYPWFEARAGRILPPPVFGENLTVCGWTEADARVGDVVRIGTTVFRVTAPTVRCHTLGRARGLPELLSWIQEDLRTGWYMAVEEPGTLRAGDAIALLRRGPEDLGVAALNGAMFRTLSDGARVTALLAREEIAPGWRRSLERKFLAREGRSKSS